MKPRRHTHLLGRLGLTGRRDLGARTDVGPSDDGSLWREDPRTLGRYRLHKARLDAASAELARRIEARRAECGNGATPPDAEECSTARASVSKKTQGYRGDAKPCEPLTGDG